MPVLLVKQRVIAFLSHPMWGLRDNVYAIHLKLVRKLVVDFLQVITAHFLLALTDETLKCVEIGLF